MTNEDLIKCIQAAERGEKIECKSIRWQDIWRQKEDTTLWNSIDYEYRIAKPEPKLVPHWPAILGGKDQGYWVSDVLYCDEQSAREDNPNFVRLAREYPEVLLEVEE